MPEFWVNIDYVGGKRAFVTGRIPENEEFEQELSPDQMRMVEAFRFEQDQAFQRFLLGVIT